MKKMSREQFEMLYNYYDIHGETCSKCGKKYLFGGVGCYDEYLFDIEGEKIATFYGNESGKVERKNHEWCRVHICDCGAVLFIQMLTVLDKKPVGIEQVFMKRSK